MRTQGSYRQAVETFGIEMDPRKCPDARLAIMGFVRSVAESKWNEQMPTNDPVHSGLAAADLYWLSRDMSGLAFESSTQLPDDTIRDDAPITRGVVFLSGILTNETLQEQLPDGEFGIIGSTLCLFWMPYRSDIAGTIRSFSRSDCGELGDADSAGVLLMLFAKPAQGEWGGVGWTLWDDGDPIEAGSAEDSGPDLRRLWFAITRLIESPGVVDEVSLPVPPVVRRRSARRGVRISSVRVIDLRGSTRHASRHGGGSEYHHRWIVKGHWRQQPYGPSNSLRKPVWIRPHVKGPDGAPLLKSEKVYALR